MNLAKKKLLIIGTDEIWSLDKIYFKHLSDFNFLEVSFFASENIFSAYYNKSLVNKVLLKLNLSSIYNKICGEIQSAIDFLQPDIIWIFKGMSIKPELLSWIKKKGIMLVNFNADHPFIFSSKGSGNTNITDSIGLYDLHLSYNLNVIEEIKKRYAIPTGFLPFGFEIPGTGQHEQVAEKCKVCFVGNPDELRIKLLRSVLNRNIGIDVYGNNWNKYINHKNLKIHPPVYGDKVWSTLKKYRVQLNIMRIHNLNSHNMRTFEVPGAAGIMLAPDTYEHRLFFEDRKECFLYKDTNECISTIEDLLNMREQEAEIIRNNALNRSISSGYSYKERAAQAIKLILASYES